MAADLAQYRAVALTLAADRERLARLRIQVAAMIADGYLYNRAARTRDWKALLSAMWQRATHESALALLGPF